MIFAMRVFELFNRIRWTWLIYSSEHSVTLSFFAVLTAVAISMTAIQFLNFIF